MARTEESYTSRHAPRTKNDLRCLCRHAPLLAVFGLDGRGRLYLHIKVYKQDRIFGNLILRGGPVELQCRECFRWHVINFSSSGPVMEETRAPAEIRQTNDDTVTPEGA